MERAGAELASLWEIKCLQELMSLNYATSGGAASAVRHTKSRHGNVLKCGVEFQTVILTRAPEGRHV